MGQYGTKKPKLKGYVLMNNSKFNDLLIGADLVSPPSAASISSVSSTVSAPVGFRPQDLEEIRKEMEEEIKQSTQSREELEVEETAWSSEDSLAAAQKFFSSAALGWGDELGLWVAAAINANVIDPFFDVETSTKDEYKRLKERYDAAQEEFKQRQGGGVSTAIDIAGAVASPATYVAAPAALAGRLGQVGSLFARAGTEGAIYGAGEAEAGQRLEGAGGGALGGLAGAGLVKGTTFGFGKTADFVSKRRVEGDLVDADGDFVPITLAASDPKGVEGLIHSFYRDVVAPSFGAKGIIREQEDVIIGKAEKAIESQKAFSKKLDEGIKGKEQQIKQQLKDAETAVKEEGKNLKAAKQNETAGRIVPLQTKLQALKAGKAEEIVAKASSETRKVLDTRRLNFRNETFINSFPEGATVKDVENVLRIEDIGSRARALDNLWNNKGYSMIKNKTFRFKSGELEKNLEAALQRDSYFRVNTVDIPAVMKVFGLAVEDVKFFKDPSGRVKGDLVSSLRSRIGTLANQAADPQNRRALYTLQDEIDKIMKSQLTTAQKNAFEKESGKWKTTVVLREAIENAQVDPKKRGYFDEADWIKEVSKNNRWDSRYGTGPLNQTARTLETNLKQAEKSVAKRATNLAKTKARLVEKVIKEHRNKLAANLDKIDSTLAAKKAALSRNPQLAAEIASDISRKEKATAEITQLDKNLTDLTRLRASPNPSWFYTLAAFSILAKGFQSGGVSGAVTAGTLALGGAAGLATPAAQRAIAGQTPTQQSIQSMLASDATGRTAQILGQAGGVLGSRSGMFTE
jgi:hypothetical protein